MNFYSSILTIEMFNVIFILIKPYLPNIVYWTVAENKNKEEISHKKSKKLTHRNEFLLTLMRLRLGILNEDLADRFCISPALC